MPPPQTQEQMRNDPRHLGVARGLCLSGHAAQGPQDAALRQRGHERHAAGRREYHRLRCFPRTATTATSQTQQFFNSTELLSRLRDVFNAAARANASIYTLDPRGLATEEFDIADNVDSATDRQMLNESTDLLRVLADQTDGRAIVGRNDPLPELRKMVRDVSSYYLLGYTSTCGGPRRQVPRDQGARQAARTSTCARARATGRSRPRKSSAPARRPRPDRPAKSPQALDELATVVEPAGRKPVIVWMGAVRGPAEKARLTLAWEVPPGAPTTPLDAVDRITITRDVDLTATSCSTARCARDPAGRDDERASDVRRPGGRGPGARRVRERERECGSTATTPATRCPTSRRRAPPSRRRSCSAAGRLETSPFAPVGTPSRRRPGQFSRTERLLLRFDVYGPAGTTPAVTLRLLNRMGASMAALPAAHERGCDLPSRARARAVTAGDYLVEIVATSGTDTARHLLGLRITG